MNQGAVRSSPVQQIVSSGSPNWWSINNTRPPPSHHPNHSLLATQPLNNLPHDELTQPLSASSSWSDYSQAVPESWSQLLLGGLVSDEDKSNMIMNTMQQGKKLEHWEHNFLNQSSNVKPEDYAEKYEFEAPKANWSQFHHQIVTDANSPNSSSVNTSLSSSNMLEFSHRFSAHECNSTGTGGPATKKAKIQPSSAQSTFKVRKEKLGDRITALHQLVSPFGKTDTASVLLEAIGYIRFLQSQVEALSLPYLGSGSRNHHQVQGERTCLFPDDPGQLLNEKCIKRKSLSEKECEEEAKKDLRSRGLCLVPISCTLHVGNDNGADYWAPAFSGNF